MDALEKALSFAYQGQEVVFTRLDKSAVFLTRLISIEKSDNLAKYFQIVQKREAYENKHMQKYDIDLCEPLKNARHKSYGTFDEPHPRRL